ncbi:hypothetical protein H9P43_007055 [Blastocladiella emersonii ATCC 22665]|nr:hypothetical protein H9P43_007055 [Blastocladiella emersonii ATCC 22665]
MNAPPPPVHTLTAPPRAGTILLDLRPAAAYESQHLAGAFSLPLCNYASRTAFPWFLLPERGSVPVALIVPPGEGYAEAVKEPAAVWEPVEGNQVATAARFAVHVHDRGWSVEGVYVPTPQFWVAAKEDGWDVRSAVEDEDGERDRDRPGSVSPSPSRDRSRSPRPAPSNPAPSTVRASLVRTMTLPFLPAPVLAATATQLFGAPGSPTPFRVLDLGCGAGRDLAYLLHHYPGCTAVAVDAWKGSIDRTRAVCSLLHFGDRVTLVRAKAGEQGELRGEGGRDAWGEVTGPFELVLLHRFLPPRTFVSAIHDRLLAQSGARMLLSTFALPEGGDFAAWTTRHASPSSFINLVHPRELTRPLDRALLSLKDAEVMAEPVVSEKWGWGFTSDAGYRVLRNETVELADGRQLVWFVVEKI